MAQSPYHYSPSKKGFYPAAALQKGSAWAGNLPDDLVPVSEARYAALMAAMAAGKEIRPNAEGKPVITALKKPPVEQRRARILTLIKREAGRRIEAIAPVWRQLNALRTDSPSFHELGQRIDAIREASSLLESMVADVPAASLGNFDIRNNPAWPSFDEDPSA